jgi:uncharacterized protein (TIGR00369 family)
MTDREPSHCFGCGVANPVGLGLKFAIDASGPGAVTSTSSVQLSRLYEGGRGNLHGGIIATLMDEAMSKLNKPLGAFAATRQMEVEYLRPSPVDAPLTLVGRHVRRDGRKLFHAAELLNAQGQVLARATGLFIVIEPAPAAT